MDSSFKSNVNDIFILLTPVLQSTEEILVYSTNECINRGFDHR